MTSFVFRATDLQTRHKDHVTCQRRKQHLANDEEKPSHDTIDDRRIEETSIVNSKQYSMFAVLKNERNRTWLL